MPDANREYDERDPVAKLPPALVRALLAHLPPGQRRAIAADPAAFRTALAVARARLRARLVGEEWRDD